MATRAASTSNGLGDAEGTFAIILRSVSNVVSAVGEGFRVRNTYSSLVKKGVDPAEAAAAAIRRESH
jgi:hypothetical protein